MSPLPPNYEHKVYAGWLGKCIGVRFGAPLENWTYQEIRDHLGELDGYLPLPESKIFKPDDDTALPLILIRALQDYGPGITAEQMGDAWLNYLGDQRATLWWGGYGVSTEHTAYLNLKAGIPAPGSGSTALNGVVMAEQIGGQIFSDIWGLVVPNNPALAADYAAKAASISHDGNGIYGGMFIAAMVSAAFSENDPQLLIETGLSVIPEQCGYAQTVRAVLDFHRQQPDDWHAAYHFIAERWGDYPGIVHIIPNAAVIVMALLYGEGDFSRTIQIANMAGWDTDCNVGNVGAVMGVAVGLEGIEQRWREPMNDLLVAASIIGTRNLTDAASNANLLADLGQEMAGESAPQAGPRYPFDLPGSTHGFRSRSHLGTVVALRQVEHAEGEALRVTMRKLKMTTLMACPEPLSLRPDRLSSNYYGASFSPTIYPGQTLHARLRLPADAPTQLRAGLCVWDDNHDQTHHSPTVSLHPGQWQELSYEIPALHGACLSEAGVVLRNLGEPWSGSILLDYLDWGGPPHFSFDFSQERHEYDAISQWTFLRGYWRLVDGAYHGGGVEVSETYTGDIDWRDYALTVGLTPLLDDYHNILARVQGALRSYALGLAPDRLVLYKNSHGYQPVASAPFPWEHGQSYELNLKVENQNLTGWITGGPELAWEDEESPYLNGQIGLSNYPGCHTRYESVALNPLGKISTT